MFHSKFVELVRHSPGHRFSNGWRLKSPPDASSAMLPYHLRYTVEYGTYLGKGGPSTNTLLLNEHNVRIVLQIETLLYKEPSHQE